MDGAVAFWRGLPKGRADRRVSCAVSEAFHPYLMPAA